METQRRTMTRVGLHLTRQQRQALQQHALESGLPAAEIVRRAIDQYLRKIERQNTRQT